MKKPMRRKMSLADRVIALVEGARQRVAQVANVAQVYTNYEIGRQIVEEEQGGKRRADYGKKILIDLSQKLTARFGRGWSVENLTLMRKFFLVYSPVTISETTLRKSGAKEIVNTIYEIPKRGEIVNTVYEIPSAEDSSNTICQIPKFTLGWSHYLLLMRIADPVERAFYEREAAQGQWTFDRLERMYRTSTFERLQISKDKDKVRKLMNRPAPDVEVAGEALKDPVVTEFLGTPDKYFYYINYFDRKVKLPDVNPTIGILLTSEKVDQALVEMFTPDSEKNRIFVKQYTSVMPSKVALKRIVIEEKRKFEKEKLLALAASKKGYL